jgi:hypothetical protein
MSTTRRYACHQVADLRSDLWLPVVISGWLLGSDGTGTEHERLRSATVLSALAAR